MSPTFPASQQHDEQYGEQHDDASAHPHPSVTVDVVVFAMFGSLDNGDNGDEGPANGDEGPANGDRGQGRGREQDAPDDRSSNGHLVVSNGPEDLMADEPELRVLLVRRRGEPFRGCWAIPGGFVRMRESLDDAARRELEEETGLRDVYLEQLYTFGGPDRDPRTRVISVAYYALLPGHVQKPRADDDTGEARWIAVTRLPANLAFDHGEILDLALRRLRAKADYAGIAREFLPPRFTLRRLRRIYEIVLGRQLDRANFTRRILMEDDIEETGETDRSGAHRPAKLYRYRRDHVRGTRDKE